jgi:hypothetical protein
MVRVLSFDCANRSLAVCYVVLNMEKKETLLNNINNNTDIKKMYTDYIDIHFIKVYDLTKGLKLNTIERSKKLKSQIKEIDTIIKTINKDKDMVEEKLEVLIEYQMSANDKSRCVSQQLIYHYIDISNVSLVGPTLKNKICLSSDDSLNYCTFIAKYMSKYTANKNHTKYNFLHWLNKIDNLDIIKNINKKNYDDAADSFIQILGWYK